MEAAAFQFQPEGLCGGFVVELGVGKVQVRLSAGERTLRAGVAQAVLRGIETAPAALRAALHLELPPRPCQRVEVQLRGGDEIRGEALPLGDGCIRLVAGEDAPLADLERVARHEALHLLLCARFGRRWSDPGLAFGEWILRGIESGGEAPRLASLPDPLPVSREEVLRQLGSARRVFGDELAAALERVEGEQRRLWLVEAALGLHYLEAARRVDEGLAGVVVDEWLADYEEYVRAVGNPPSAAGHVWRVGETGFARDPLVRLSAAAQALQPFDACWFAEDATADEPLVWKSRGVIRVPIARPRGRARPPPLHAFRAAVRDAPELARLVEEAARGAEGFEARVLWPRILARVLARKLAEVPPRTAAVVQPLDGAGADAVARSFAVAAEALAGGVRVESPQPLSTLPSSGPSLLLVHPSRPAAPELLAIRKLAARRRVRAALFADFDAALDERLPDVDPPLDPRYRESIFHDGAADVAAVDEATKDGRLSTPVSFLLSLLSFGIEEA